MQAPDHSSPEGLPSGLGNSSKLEQSVNVRLCFHYRSDKFHRNALHAALVLRYRKAQMQIDQTHVTHTWGLRRTGNRTSLPSADLVTLPSTTGDFLASA